ncbi:STAS-like domain-containing protein [Cryptosporangium sp. NPDC048952]|uniref:STAS-like domain-containing protein n=1 Tax=Cryptosporangium sp. NPDC048952 TaxID=3363961 RepID=UPI00371B580E
MKPESAAPFLFTVGSHNDFLSTRDLGKTVLRDLEDQTPADTATVIINFTGVVAMTHSFADEFLGQYYSALATQDGNPTTVFVTELNDELRETLTVCFERRDLIALEVQGQELGLLAASEVLNQTFALAQELRTFTAMNIAEHLKITAPNANNRLKRLVAARTLLRELRVAERGGKEFTYSVPIV